MNTHLPCPCLTDHTRGFHLGKHITIDTSLGGRRGSSVLVDMRVAKQSIAQERVTRASNPATQALSALFSCEHARLSVIQLNPFNDN
jgi:hypothetical protein